jgi:hypothetical protein
MIECKPEGRNLSKAVTEAGGKLIQLQFKPWAMSEEGCRSPIHVVGTNGGTIPCGAYLTQLNGEREQMLCEHCTKD